MWWKTEFLQIVHLCSLQMFLYMVQYNFFICFVFQVKVRSREHLHSKVTTRHALPGCKKRRDTNSISWTCDNHICFVRFGQTKPLSDRPCKSWGVSSCPSKHETGHDKKGVDGLLHLPDIRSQQLNICIGMSMNIPISTWQRRNWVFLFLNIPIVLCYTDVGFQRGQEEFYKLSIG